MQTLLWRIKHVPLCLQLRLYSVASARPSHFPPKSLSAIDQLEKDGARILRAVRKRVEERTNILAQMSEDMSSPEDIKRARQVKQLERLKTAWDEWETNRQVRRFFRSLCTQVLTEVFTAVAPPRNYATIG